MRAAAAATTVRATIQRVRPDGNFKYPGVCASVERVSSRVWSDSRPAGQPCVCPPMQMRLRCNWPRAGEIVCKIPGTTTFALIDFPDRRISYRNADETTRRWSASVSCFWKTRNSQKQKAKKALRKCVSHCLLSSQTLAKDRPKPAPRPAAVVTYERNSTLLTTISIPLWGTVLYVTTG